METTTVRIGRRFRGPERSGNGGYTAGLLGTTLGPGPVQVTLRRPPPLETELTIAYADGAATLTGDELIAEAHRSEDLGDIDDTAEPVTVDRALAAEALYAGLEEHPFPGCFACGPANDAGLRLRPGRYGEGRTACTWTPTDDLGGEDDLVDPVYVWAALDCPGGWTADIGGRPMVLGRHTVRIDELPAVGETHVVSGRLVGAEGRKTFTAATLYTADGRALAQATHTWIHVDPAAFN